MAELGANARFWIAAEDGERAFGPGPAELLVHIQELGSIRQAACAMQMSYTKALRILEGSETALGVSLVTRNAGGADGGGAKLTPQGADLALRYKAWEEASKKAAEEAYQAAFAGLLAPRLGCCILASGRGVRFGGQKLLAPLGDGTVLGKTLAQVPEDLFRIVVVTATDEVAEAAAAAGAEVVAPEGPLQSDSVRAGVRALGECAGILFCPGDQPFVSEASLRRMAEAFFAHPASPVRLAWKGEGRSPAIFPKRLFSALEGLSGDAGGGALLKARPDEAAATIPVEAAAEEELFDIDTAEDLGCAEEMLREEQEGER